MEDERIKFTNKEERQGFFKELTVKLACRNYKQLARKLEIKYDNLKQWRRGARSVPLSLFQNWLALAGIDASKYKTEKISINQTLKCASKLGVQKLKEKYGKNWMKILGKRGRRKLQKLLKTNPDLYKKWRKSIANSLKTRYGPECYKILGREGGRISVSSIPPKRLRRQLKKAFRKSFKFRLEYCGLKLRSKPELEVVKFLTARKIPFKYEKEISGFFPDFLIGNNLIIEVIGFDWKPRIEKVRSKIKKLLGLNYEIVVYTYPNMVKYFDDLPIKIITKLEELNDVLAYNRAKVSSSGSW